MMKYTWIKTTLRVRHEKHSMNRNDIAPVYIPIARPR